jgi:hypothetical protein
MEPALINPYARQNCSHVSARCFPNATASRSSLSVWVCVNAPTATCTERGFPSAAGARRCGSAAVICAAP